MDWGTDLWDQHDVIEKHTQSGLELVERYVKFVKERTEIEQSYAKQLRSLTKKYSRRGSKEELDSKFTNHQSFQEILNELNDYAGQREVVAENMTLNICVELTKYLHELKQERKTYLSDAKKAQQNLESSYKQLESTKKRFEKEWKEAEKVSQQAEKTEQDSTSTKADVEKARQHAHFRTHTADEYKNDYAAQLQKYNKEQNQFYYTEIPTVFNKLQELDERRISMLAQGYCLFANTEKKVMPIITKCLDGISMAGGNTNGKQDSLAFIEHHKSGLERPADVEFEDYSQGIKPAPSDTLNLPKVRLKHIFHKRTKLPPPSFIPPGPSHSLINGHPLSKFSNAPLSYCLRSLRRPVKPRTTSLATPRPTISSPDKNMPPPAEDFSHLPPEQRKKKLQQKIDDVSKELQKEMDQSEALNKMRGVYEQNAALGDPTSLEPQITQTAQTVSRLKGELAKYESWLSEAGGIGEILTTLIINNNQTSSVMSGPAKQSVDNDNLYECDFDEDFDEDIEVPVGQCMALYNFDGSSQGTVSMLEGEQLSVMEQDQGDGWMRVQRANGDEGYVPASYIKTN